MTTPVLIACTALCALAAVIFACLYLRARRRAYSASQDARYAEGQAHVLRVELEVGGRA